MRIHLPLHPHHFAADSPAAGGPFARIGGELVVIELQGELTWEGEKSNGVVGVLGLDRPDKPTFHIGEHHLLHGKVSTLPKPYAVIRRVRGEGSTTVDGDAADEESDAEREAEVGEDERTPKKPKHGDEEDEDEPPLFPEQTSPLARKQPQLYPPSSPFPSSMPSSAHDYSSDLEMSSPPRQPESDDEDDEARRREREREAQEKARKAERRARRRAERPERTRHYEVVGIVRKKLVFALRPEPLVAATPLPE